MFLKALVLSVCLSFAAAYTETGFVQPKPEKYKHIEGCYLEDIDAVVPFGRSTPPNRCYEVLCGTETYDIFGCSLKVEYDAKAKPGCHTYEDKEKPFPECCPAKICGPEEKAASRSTPKN